MIQTAKRTLLIILGSKRLSLDVFQTILLESETIMISRPLTNIADLPDNEMPLTPNHFLISRPFNSLPLENLTARFHQQMMNHFWKRLVKKYLPTLLKRSKWNENNQSTIKFKDFIWILNDSSWNLASWVCVRGVTWTRWTTSCGEGKNGLRYVCLPHFRTRTRFG